MANNPLQANEISFWLRFNSLNNPNFYRISEPIGFDGAKFVLEQESKRFARSVKYGALDKLKFIKEKGEAITSPQVINPQGDTSMFLDYGLEWLLYIYSEYGFEMDVDFLIKVNGVDFKIYGLNVADKDVTDGYTYFQCSLIDNSKVMDYKRRMDDKLNAFGTKGIFEQVVTPITAVNYLRRAIPQVETSDFSTNGDFVLNDVLYGLDAYVYNPAIQLNTYGVSNTLTSFEVSTYDPDTSNTSLTVQLIQDRTIVKAKRRISNLKLEIKNLNFSAFINSGFFVNHRLRVAYGNTPLTDWNTIDLFSTSSTSYVLTNQSYTVNIPFLEIGQKVWLYFSSTSPNPLPSPTPITSMSVIIGGTLTVDITANSLALDTVLKAVRYVDLIKQGNKMVHNLPFNAPLFDTLGKFYDQFVFNKAMVTQRMDYLYFTLKDIFGSVEEVCADVELNENELFIGQYPDYYTNDEIGVYSVIPSETLNIDVNDRFATNKMLYNYSKFAQERSIVGSTQSVHTQSENKVQNTKVENSKEVKNDLIRDPFLIQDTVNLEITKPTTSTDSDNDLNIEDAVALAPNSFGEFGAILLMRIVNGRLEILNRDSNGDVSDTVINWNVLGFGVGSTIQITAGANQGFYSVFALTSTVLTLTYVSGVLNFQGDGYIRFKYYYQNVQWQTRTNQGFALIDGVGSSFANLRYTIKRNLFYWYPYLATMVMYCKKDIINSFFKSNGKLKTRLTTETVDVIEDAPILYADLPQPILTGKIYNLTVVSDYQDELNRLDLYLGNSGSRLPNPKKGFCRFLDLKGNVIKGYIQKSEYLLASNQLTVTIEEKYEAQILVVNYANGVLTVNDTTYQLSGNAQWFKFENDFVRFYDSQNREICKFYKYNFVSLNGVIYSSANDLATALNLLI
jgi:hypothetical protein